MEQTFNKPQATQATVKSTATEAAGQSSNAFTAAQPSLVLGKYEVIPASPKVWAVQKEDDIIHGINLKLSNMFKGFPFEAAGHTWKDSERLYLLGEFSNDTAEHRMIQEALVNNYAGGYAAKRYGKSKFKKQVREDFDGDFRLQWMLWVVWQKTKGNKDFQNLLLQIPSDVYVLENTSTDTGGTAKVWGCCNKELTKARKAHVEKVTAANSHLSKKAHGELIAVERNKIDSVGTWEGENNMGKILMTCRNCIIDGTEPQIDLDLLRSKQIHILGQLLTF